MIVLTGSLAALTVIGAVQVLAGWCAVARFTRRALSRPPGTVPITILKPLHGQEPLLEAALTTLCEQDYPPGFQIVFGVHDASDTAIPLVSAASSNGSCPCSGLR